MGEKQSRLNFMNNVRLSPIINKNIGNLHVEIKFGFFCYFGKELISNSMHYHEDIFEVCFVVSGGGKFVLDDKIYSVRMGDIFVAPPKIAHEIFVEPDSINENDREMELFFFSFLFKCISSDIIYDPKAIILSEFIYNHKVIATNQYQILEYIRFISEYSPSNRWAEESIRSFLENMAFDSICALMNHPTEQNVLLTVDPLYKMAFDYISDHLTQKIYVKDVATYCNTSIRNLQYIFKAQCNQTITEVINQEKMRLARSYLKMNFNVTQVSYKIGINNPESFSRVFKRYYGISPKQYQEKVIGHNEE